MGGMGSAVVRRQLGRRLQNLRLESGMSIRDVSAAKLGSKAKMSRVEAGQQVIRIADVWAWCEFYGADAVTKAALSALAPGTQQADWWELQPGVVPEWFCLYAGLEATACRIRSFEPLLVNGLVQTEAYARAVLSGDPRMSSDVVEQRVRFRMERQQRSWDGVTVIMGESALNVEVGSPEIMAAQIEHLRAATVDIRILPYSAGPCPLPGSWAMLEFDDVADPSVVFVEGGGVARYLDRHRDWAQYAKVWGKLMNRAVPIGEWPA